MLFEGEGDGGAGGEVGPEGVHQDGLAADWFPFVRDARARPWRTRWPSPRRRRSRERSRRSRRRRGSTARPPPTGARRRRAGRGPSRRPGTSPSPQRGSEATRRCRDDVMKHNAIGSARRRRSQARKKPKPEKEGATPARSRATPEGEGEGCAARGLRRRRVDELNGLSLACLHRHVGYRTSASACRSACLPVRLRGSVCHAVIRILQSEVTECWGGAGAARAGKVGIMPGLSR